MLRDLSCEPSQRCDLYMKIYLSPVNISFCSKALNDFVFHYVLSASPLVLLSQKSLALWEWWMGLLIVSNFYLHWKTLWNTTDLVTLIHCSSLLIPFLLAAAPSLLKKLYVCLYEACFQVKMYFYTTVSFQVFRLSVELHVLIFKNKPNRFFSDSLSV